MPTDSAVSNSRLITITDRHGTLVLPKSDCAEPNPGSILLTGGIWGTAWQKHFSDGLWHPTGGGSPQTWECLITRRKVVLVYDAEPRPAKRGKE